MTNINKGIINTGSIGGNASVTVTDYGSGNVIAPGSVVDIKQRAQKAPGLIGGVVEAALEACRRGPIGRKARDADRRADRDVVP